MKENQTVHKYQQIVKRIRSHKNKLNNNNSNEYTQKECSQTKLKERKIY